MVTYGVIYEPCPVPAAQLTKIILNKFFFGEGGKSKACVFKFKRTMKQKNTP